MDIYASLPFHFYTAFWSKYRPALLKLMIDAEQSPQQYKLYPHEFKASNPKARGSQTFTLHVFKGKAINNIRNSSAAQDLLLVLEVSKRALELMNNNAYEFTLDKNFILHVSKIDAPDGI